METILEEVRQVDVHRRTALGRGYRWGHGHRILKQERAWELEEQKM